MAVERLRQEEHMVVSPPFPYSLRRTTIPGDRVRRGEREDCTPPRCAPSWSPSNATRSAAASPRSSLLPRDSRGGMSGRRPVILLVEDAEVNRVVVRRMVRELGVGLEEAENGQVAVELLRRGRHYDLILMDKDMPVMDGHEATRQLRSLGVKTPIVALSGNGLPSDRELFFRAGADEFQMKPLSMAGLAALLARHGLS